MSVQAISWAMEQTTGSGTRKAVLVALANCYNHHTGRCCPKVDRLARETELSERTVRRALIDLEERGGFIQRERARRADGTYGIVHYTFRQMDSLSEPAVTGAASPAVTGAGQEPEVDLEPKTTPGTEANASVLVPTDEQRIFEHWRKARAKPQARFTDNRRAKIRARLKDFSEAELIDAIDGIACDPWSERSQHDDLVVVFRNAEQVERFIAFGRDPPRRKGGMSVEEIWGYGSEEDAA